MAFWRWFSFSRLVGYVNFLEGNLQVEAQKVKKGQDMEWFQVIDEISQGLRSADWSLFGGKSDPYCIVGTSKCDLNSLHRKWLEIREVFRYFSLFFFLKHILLVVWQESRYNKKQSQQLMKSHLATMLFSCAERLASRGRNILLGELVSCSRTHLRHVKKRHADMPFILDWPMAILKFW